jgi:tetratricopeptide (TPR) repeat protein
MSMKVILAGLLILASVAVAAEMSKEEREAYQAWYDANAAQDWPKAIEAAKVYRDSFPQGEYADYLKKWDHGLRVQFFADAVRAKNSDEMIKRGSDLLAEEPDNLDVIYTIVTTLRVNELWAKPPVYTHAGEATAFALKAAQLIEAGQVPASADKTKWNKESVLGTLYLTLALIEKNNKNTDKAIEYYTKAATADPSNPNYALSAGILSYTKYQEAARKYRELVKDDANKDKPETKAVKEEADRRADAAIANYTQFLKATEGNANYTDQRAKVEKGLADAKQFRTPEPPPAPAPPRPPETPATPPASTTP